MSVAALQITVSGSISWETNLVRQRAFGISQCRLNPAADETSGMAHAGCKVCATKSFYEAVIHRCRGIGDPGLRAVTLRLAASPQEPRQRAVTHGP